MKFPALMLAALACCFAVSGSVSAQVPMANDEPSLSNEDVPRLERSAPAVVSAPAPSAVTAAARRVDAAALVSGVSNSVVTAGAAWNNSLGTLSTGDAEIDRLIVECGNRHGVDPKLVYAVMHQESRFKNSAVSGAGACGYMQLMPGTARRFGVTNIFDPAQNINAGTRYLRVLLDLFDNNVELALAGYNAGEYRVIRDGYRVPQIRETQNYVRLITANYYGRTSGRPARQIAVTQGPSLVSKKQQLEIQRIALASKDDRGTETLSNF